MGFYHYSWRSTSHQSKERLMNRFAITFNPALLCFVPDCEYLTSWGIAEQGDGNIEITPACWRHGCFRAYEKTDDIREEEQSVVRFVVGMHDGKGTATVLAPLSLEDAPGFHAWQR